MVVTGKPLAPSSEKAQSRSRSERSRGWLPCRPPAPPPGAHARGSRQPPQRPRPVPQPHHVDCLAGGEPEPLPGQPTRADSIELISQQSPQVAHQRGAFPVPMPELPVAPPACDAVAQGRGKAGDERRHGRPVGCTFHTAQQPRRPAFTHVRPPAFLAPVPAGRNRWHSRCRNSRGAGPRHPPRS